MTYIPASGGSGFPSFVDNFDGASLADNWILYGNNSTDMTAAPSGGKLVMEIKNGYDGANLIPRIFMPVPYVPCEIEAKLHSYNKGNRTKTGVIIGADSHAETGNVDFRAFLQCYSSGDGIDGCRVEGNAQALSSVESSTVPKWFKVVIKGSHRYAQWLFYWSTNGTSWTLNYTSTVASLGIGALFCGLMIGNWYNQPLAQAQWEYFKVSPYLQYGPG